LVSLLEILASLPMGHTMKSTLLLAFLISVGVPRQESDLDDFRDEYTKNQKQLIDKYIKNKKAVVKFKVYRSTDAAGNPTGFKDEEHRFEIISDGEQIRLFTKESTDPKSKGTYWFKTGDSSFFLSKGSLGGWQVSQVTFPTKGVIGSQGGGFANIIRCPMGAQNYLFDFFTWIQSPQGNPNLSMVQPEFLSVEEVLRNGILVTKVTGKLKAMQPDRTYQDYKCYFYFDRNDYYATVGYETDFFQFMRQDEPSKIRTTIEYEIKNNKKIAPKKYETTIYLKDGRKILDKEFEFVEFSDYTPGPEEFFLEKEFGIATPRNGEKNQDSFGGSLVFYLLAGLAGCFGVWLILFIRKRK